MCWVGALPCAAEEHTIKVPLGSLLPRNRVREIGVKKGGEAEPCDQRGRGHVDKRGEVGAFSLTLLVCFIKHLSLFNRLERKSKGESWFFPTGRNGPFHVAHNTQNIKRRHLKKCEGD